MRAVNRERRQLSEDVDGEGSWAISYGDMVTLLLCFFILFFTTDHSKDHQQRLTKTLLDVMKSASAPSVPTASADVGLGKNADGGLDNEMVKVWDGAAHQVGDKLVVEFPGISFFKSSATDLTEDGQAALRRFVSLYMPYAGQHTLSIRAFTDRRKVTRGAHRYEDNLELSALRSVATMRYLRKLGIPPEQVRLGGHGELVTTAEELARLPAAERSQKEFDLARRVVLVIEPERRFGL